MKQCSKSIETKVALMRVHMEENDCWEKQIPTGATTIDCERVDRAQSVRSISGSISEPGALCVSLRAAPVTRHNFHSSPQPLSHTHTPAQLGCQNPESSK